MKQKTEERLRSWLAGELDDDELTKKEIKQLEESVFNAVAKVMLAREGSMTFAEHRTIQ